MRPSSREIWLALLAILFITLTYLLMLVILAEVPAASGFYGHAMGVLGFVLMLSTETLYSLRKRSRNARWGRMASWLQFHIFTGLVGPYLVLLHSSWKFNGVAGILMLMTVVIVISGFVGRYIYTAVPRTSDGIEVEAGELEEQIAGLETQLQGFTQSAGQEPFLAAPQMAALSTTASQGPAASAGGDRAWPARLSGNQRDPTQRDQARQLRSLLKRRALLKRQVNSLAAARRLLAVWHTIHIPIGLGLFGLAFVHIAAAIYYATLLR